MASPRPSGDGGPSRAGYFAAIVISALGHAALFVAIFYVVPRYLSAPAAPPPAYTVKIVDNLPAGNLGTHLPRLHRVHESVPQAEAHKPEPPKPVSPKTPPPSDNDKNAIALNDKGIATPTPTPEVTPPPPTPEITPTPEPTAKPTHKPRVRATPKPTPNSKEGAKPRARPSVMIALAAPTPSVKEQLAKIREQMLKEHLADEAARANNDEDEDEDSDETPAASSTPSESGGGPVTASRASEGSGYGVGPGTGSAGILQDPEFLLYYQTVQDKIKKAWSFTGGSPDLTATVTFAVGPDGQLTGVKISQSSNNPAFDDSVVRAIRSAGPFPPPPEKYRSEFAAGVQALFKLGELKS